ncbi:MAG: hypothetical protein QOI66_2133 [Myxococcales bacterium]|jgi:hypothetical protein|nr:hypothetical protein [Myxococcales bacterium]
MLPVEPRPRLPAVATGPATTLAQIERQFFTLITAPEGVGPGLSAQGLGPDDLARMIQGDERASAVDRLDIYANMYFYRIRDTLGDYFPATVAVLDESGFHNLITDYLLAHPSAHPSLREVGKHLPTFTAGHALAAQRPWLGELVALEWARLDVFDRVDQLPLTREHLAALPPEAFATLSLLPIRAHALVPSSYAIDDLWSAVQDDQPLPSEEPTTRPQPAAFLVWRRELAVYHRVVDAAEGAALAWINQGLRFGELCERLADNRAPEEAARLGSAWLAQWLADGLLAKI